MSIGRIIVPVSGARLLESKLDHAFALATQFGAHINILFLHGYVDPQSVERNPFFEAGWETAEVEWSGEEAEFSDIRTRLDRWSQSKVAAPPIAAAASGNRRPELFEIRSDYAQAMLDHGRTSDLIVIGQPGPGMALIEGEINRLAVTETGRLVLVVPAGPGASNMMLSHVLVAWDAGLQASRCVALAMPFLTAAERTSVYLSVDAAAAENRQELMRNYLACKGLTADFLVCDDGTHRIGRVLLERAYGERVSLICMGAYERDRTQQLIIGGTTRHVYFHSQIPLLLSA
jgi:nucleotide-binding universal stress UspA family protein